MSASTPRIVAHPTALIAQDAILSGGHTITLGPGVVVHPRAAVLALRGDIELGADCVVEELAVLRNGHGDEAGDGGGGRGEGDAVARDGGGGGAMRIGDGNQFLVGCRIESLSIGHNNTFHPRCTVPRSITITHDCSIGPGVVLLPSLSLTSSTDSATTTSSPIETIPPYTAISGSAATRREDGISTLSAPTAAAASAATVVEGEELRSGGAGPGARGAVPDSVTVEDGSAPAAPRLIEDEIKRKRLEFLRDNLPKYCRMRAV